MKLLKALVIGILFFQPVYASQADIQNIPSSEYFSTALTEISQAKESIYVVMYLVSFDPANPNTKVSQLLKALVDAKNRGVWVQVIFDQTIDFAEDQRPAEGYRNKNAPAFEYLRANQVEVFYDTEGTYTHAKAIVIDREISLFGSSNWSRAALTKNNEVNAMVRSSEFAQDLIDQWGKIELQPNVAVVAAPSVKIPRDFLTNPALFQEMISHGDERALDVYLYLLSQYRQTADSKVILDYDDLASSLAMSGMAPVDYRRQITKTLSKLKGKYRLIDFQNPTHGQNAQITLKAPEAADSFDLPLTYWKYHWPQKLSFPAKVMYLILISNTDLASPSFTISREGLANEFSISKSLISDGTRDLRFQNLLDIQYSPMDREDFSDRKPNSYTPTPLYDPSALQESIAALGQKEGQAKLDRALNAASQVFAQNNLSAIKSLLDLESQYGPAIIHQAAQKIGEKKSDNPKRSIAYLIATIKSMARIYRTPSP